MRTHLLKRCFLLLGFGYCQASVGMDLPSAIRHALDFHPAIRGERFEREASEFSVSTAKNQFLPTPSLSQEKVSAGTNDSIYRGDATTRVARLQQPLWTWGRLTSGLNKNEFQLKSAEFSLLEAQEKLAQEVISGWVDVLAAQERVTHLADSLQRHQQLENMVKNRVDAGASAEVDAVLASSRLERVKAQHESAKIQLNSARDRLSQTTGVKVSEIDAGLLPVLGMSLDTTLDASMARAPHLRRLEFDIKTAGETYSEVKAAALPEVYARFERVHNNYANPLMTSGDSSRTSIGFQTNLGAGLTNWENTKKAQKQMEIAQERKKAGEIDLINQIQSDIHQLNSLDRQQPLLEKSLENSLIIFDSSNRLFVSGRKSWYELMNSAKELQDNYLEYIDIKYKKLQLNLKLTLMSMGLSGLGV